MREQPAITRDEQWMSVTHSVLHSTSVIVTTTSLSAGTLGRGRRGWGEGGGVRVGVVLRKFRGYTGPSIKCIIILGKPNTTHTHTPTHTHSHTCTHHTHTHTTHTHAHTHRPHTRMHPPPPPPPTHNHSLLVSVTCKSPGQTVKCRHLLTYFHSSSGKLSRVMWASHNAWPQARI